MEAVLGSEEGDLVQEAELQEGDSDARGLVQALRADPPEVPAADIDIDSGEGNVTTTCVIKQRKHFWDSRERPLRKRKSASIE